MSRKTWYTRLVLGGLVLFAAVLMAVAAVGCGSDDDDDDSGGGTTPAAGLTPESGAPPTGDEPTIPPSNGDAPSGGGSGTLSVDGKTFDLDVFFCGFTAEETRNDTVPFSMRASGSDDGRDLTVDGSIVDLSLGESGFDSVTHTLDVWYDDDELNHIYSSESGEFQIDGKHVTLDADFSGADEQSVGTGTLDINCP